MRRVGVIALWLLGVVAVVYVVALGGLYVFQRNFYYPAPGGGKSRAAAPEAGTQDITIKTADGLSLRAFYRPAQDGLPTLIFFHGNGDGLDGSTVATRELAQQGYGVLLPEYRGYGGNSGTADEQGLYRDGIASVDWLEQQGLKPGEIVLIGNSLGSGVATEIATRKPVGGLAIVSGFASLPGVVSGHYPMVPRFLVRDRYENVAKIGGIKMPILIYHGDGDSLVPIANALALKTAQPAATLVIESREGHGLVYMPIAAQRIRTWLEAHFPADPGAARR